MTELSQAHVVSLDRLLTSGASLPTAFSQSIGGTYVSGMIWRFFSDSWPEGGIAGWNDETGWKVHWAGQLPTQMFSFGEDLFGNQLALAKNIKNVLLWDHETGECHDLFVAPCELLKTVIASGIDWVDFYSNGSLAIAREYGDVPLDMHLHWTTPLFLGGAVTLANVSLVPRQPHLIGHGKLWRSY
jgi:hypothetical protein